MEEDISNVLTGSSFSSRHRSPAFTRKEVMALINLIEKNKKILFNKSTTAAVNQAKDRVWLKVSKSFNCLGFEHKRTPDSLKTKFENLKRHSKKFSKNVLENDNEYDEATKYFASLVYDSENNKNTPENLNMEEVLNEAEYQKESTTGSFIWNVKDGKYSDDSLDEADINNKRSIDFSPEECSLLLQCIRQEKKMLFPNGKTPYAYKARERAWSRITYCFNRKSPRKRSTKVLRTKFCNMKRFAKSIRFKDLLRSDQKHEKLVEESDSKIKLEPMLQDEEDESSCNELDNSQHPVAPMDNTHAEVAADPLSTLHNKDCKTDSMIPTENKDIVRLKLELLNYELETAKLERRRVEMLMEAEAAERSSRALEAALRLRAARLAAEAEAARFPPLHPALHIAPHEAPAHQYLTHYQT